MPEVKQLNNRRMMETKSQHLEPHSYEIVDVIFNSFNCHALCWSMSVSRFLALYLKKWQDLAKETCDPFF